VPVRARVARRAGAAAARTGWRPPHADRARFGFDGQPPEILVQLIDGERSLGEGERAACIGAREARAGDALEQVDVAGAQPAQIAIGPAIVAACERLLSDCGGGSGGSDPLNVLFWQYGEGQPMNGHVADDTHWGHYSGWVPRANQWICGDSDGAIGNYTVNTAQSFDDQEGHGGWSCTCGVHAHLRLWYAPHGHSAIVDKWTTIDASRAHRLECRDRLTHHIDEDWETWEYHIGTEFTGHN
jgi:hypothetical protein